MRFISCLAAMALLPLAAGAQGFGDISGPRETPPATFGGAQYVDSGGCVFVRAGVDGRVVWVPRVNAKRQPLCGYPPTALAAAAPPPAAPVVAASAQKPAAPAAAPAPAAAKPVAARPAAKGRQPAPDDYVMAPVAGSKPGTLRCPARAPVATRAPLRGGGSVILCLSRSGLLDERASVARLEAVVPAAAESAVACPRTAPVARQLPLRGGGSTVLCGAGDGSLTGLAVPGRPPAPARVTRITVPAPVSPMLTAPVVPRGYKLAWSDDRLNAKRGHGTVAGQLAQDQVWTRETPARLVTRATAPERAAVSAPAAEPGIRVSTSGQAGPKHYVQVGAFARAAAAAAAAARIADFGLPAARARTSDGAVKIVLAGPFPSRADARRALTLLRAQGFPDAILR